MTVKLCDCVIPTYSKVWSSQQSGITCTTFVLDEFFCSVISFTYWRISFRFSREKVWPTSNEKNVSVISKQLHAAVVGLDKVGAWPDETYGNVFTILPSEVMTTSEQSFIAFKLRRKLITSPHFRPLQPHSMVLLFLNPLLIILWDANDLDNNFATSNKLVVNCQITACFNYGGDHGLNH